MSLGERIIEFRAKHNMSQEDFANLVQVNVMTVSAIENGRRQPLRKTAKKIEMIIKESEKNAEGSC